MVSDDQIQQAAEIIRSGGVVAFPTETVYGLGANALDPQAVDRIYELKGRPNTSPLIVHAASIEQARSLVTWWPPEADTLARTYWPGPLTMVLPKIAAVPDNATAGLDTVGVRVPNHPVALRLIELAQVPIAAPSANLFTQLSPTTAQHVRDAFGDEILVLDGGPTDIGIESTVITFNRDKILLLRPGMITIDGIEDTLHPENPDSESADTPHASPGLHKKHYAPRTPLLVDKLPPGSGRGAWMWITTDAVAARRIQMPAEPARYARHLYSTLHALDVEGYDWIAVECPPNEPQWRAILDRLKRAAS
jgi:L-threonylcarbamoyladenylate synthase